MIWQKRFELLWDENEMCNGCDENKPCNESKIKRFIKKELEKEYQRGYGEAANVYMLGKVTHGHTDPFKKEKE